MTGPLFFFPAGKEVNMDFIVGIIIGYLIYVSWKGVRNK